MGTSRVRLGVGHQLGFVGTPRHMAALPEGLERVVEGRWPRPQMRPVDRRLAGPGPAGTEPAVDADGGHPPAAELTEQGYRHTTDVRLIARRRRAPRPGRRRS